MNQLRSGSDGKLWTWPARRSSALDCRPIAAFQITRLSTPISRPSTVANTGFGRSSKVHTSEVADNCPTRWYTCPLPRLAMTFYCNCHPDSSGRLNLSQIEHDGGTPVVSHDRHSAETGDDLAQQ